MKKLTIEFSTSTGCNLACKYCYSNHNPSVMTIEVADKFFDILPQALEIYKCDCYHISYFGGEPTTNWEIIEYTLPKFKADPKCKSVVLITNGLLLNQQRIDFLKVYKCGISWSFDGLNSDFRPLANGFSSFEKYLKVMPLIKQITNSVKVTISKFDNLVDNFMFFKSQGYNTPDFTIVRDPIYSKSNIEIFKKQCENLADIIIFYCNSIPQNDFTKMSKIVSVGFFDLCNMDILAANKFGKRNKSCFAGNSGFVYTTDGKIYPCERFRSNSKFEIYNGTFNLENIKFLESGILNPKNFEKCKKCELFDFCNTGCAYSQLQNGNFKKSIPAESVCELTKIIFKNSIKIYKESENYRLYINSKFNNSIL